jgi:ComF family protein
MIRAAAKPFNPHRFREYFRADVMRRTWLRMSFAVSTLDILSRVQFRRLLTHVLDFAYPSVCANCDATVADAGQLCGDCTKKLEAMADAPACEFCAMPLATYAAQCPHCLGKGLPHFERVIRLGVFEDPLKHLIHQMKYHKGWVLGEFLAERLFATERAKGLLTETDVLVPVPLHFMRHVTRGYNQADVIARRLGRRSGTRVLHALRRTRDTETQTHLASHDKRVENVRGAFALRRAAARQIRGRHVIVVDDVMTSGSTLHEVARTLKDAEPASICAAVLAIADRKGRGFEVI